MKQQLYFFDIIIFLALAVGIALHVPRGTRFYAGMALAAVSFLFWIAARAQLGASFSATAQAKKLVTTGLYAWFRNPVYLFGTLAYVGLLIAWGRTGGLIVGVFIVLFQAARARKEAGVLEQAFGDEYRAYKKRTLL